MAHVEHRRLADQENLRVRAAAPVDRGQRRIEPAGNIAAEEGQAPRPLVQTREGRRAVDEVADQGEGEDQAAEDPPGPALGPVGTQSGQDCQAGQEREPEPVEPVRQQPPGQEEIGRVSAQRQDEPPARRAARTPGARRPGKAETASPIGRRRRPASSRTTPRVAAFGPWACSHWASRAGSQCCSSEYRVAQGINRVAMIDHVPGQPGHHHDRPAQKIGQHRGDRTRPPAVNQRQQAQAG